MVVDITQIYNHALTIEMDTVFLTVSATVDF